MFLGDWPVPRGTSSAGGAAVLCFQAISRRRSRSVVIRGELAAAAAPDKNR